MEDAWPILTICLALPTDIRNEARFFAALVFARVFPLPLPLPMTCHILEPLHPGRRDDVAVNMSSTVLSKLNNQLVSLVSSPFWTCGASSYSSKISGSSNRGHRRRNLAEIVEQSDKVENVTWPGGPRCIGWTNCNEQPIVLDRFPTDE